MLASRWKDHSTWFRNMDSKKTMRTVVNLQQSPFFGDDSRPLAFPGAKKVLVFGRISAASEVLSLRARERLPVQLRGARGQQHQERRHEFVSRLLDLSPVLCEKPLTV